MSKELARYLLTRFGQLVLIVFIAVSVNFLIPRLLPGDPVQTVIAKMQASGAQQSVDMQAVAQAYRAKYGLDQSMLAQYINYWRDLFHLDLGVSFANLRMRLSAGCSRNCSASKDKASPSGMISSPSSRNRFSRVASSRSTTSGK